MNRKGEPRLRQLRPATGSTNWDGLRTVINRRLVSLPRPLCEARVANQRPMRRDTLMLPRLNDMKPDRSSGRFSWNSVQPQDLRSRPTIRELRASRLRDPVEADELPVRGDTEGFGCGAIVGQSKALRRVIAQARQVAATDSTVMLLGETGTGKELVA